jgi:hypothetical protein
VDDDAVNLNDDNEKSVNWLRKALKTGGIAGGIAGVVVGCLYVAVMVSLSRGLAVMVSAAGGFKDEPDYGVSFYFFIQLAAVFGGSVLGGAVGGCLLGVVAGRLMRGRGGFVPVTAVAGVVGGVFGAYCLSNLCIMLVYYLEYGND